MYWNASHCSDLSGAIRVSESSADRASEDKTLRLSYARKQSKTFVPSATSSLYYKYPQDQQERGLVIEEMFSCSSQNNIYTLPCPYSPDMISFSQISARYNPILKGLKRCYPGREVYSDQVETNYQSQCSIARVTHSTTSSRVFSVGNYTSKKLSPIAECITKPKSLYSMRQMSSRTSKPSAVVLPRKRNSGECSKSLPKSEKSEIDTKKGSTELTPPQPKQVQACNESVEPPTWRKTDNIVKKRSAPLSPPQQKQAQQFHDSLDPPTWRRAESIAKKRSTHLAPPPPPPKLVQTLNDQMDPTTCRKSEIMAKKRSAQFPPPQPRVVETLHDSVDPPTWRRVEPIAKKRSAHFTPPPLRLVETYNDPVDPPTWRKAQTIANRRSAQFAPSPPKLVSTLIEPVDPTTWRKNISNVRLRSVPLITMSRILIGNNGRLSPDNSDSHFIGKVSLVNYAIHQIPGERIGKFEHTVNGSTHHKQIKIKRSKWTETKSVGSDYSAPSSGVHSETSTSNETLIHPDLDMKRTMSCLTYILPAPTCQKLAPIMEKVAYFAGLDDKQDVVIKSNIPKRVPRYPRNGNHAKLQIVGEKVTLQPCKRSAGDLATSNVKTPLSRPPMKKTKNYDCGKKKRFAENKVLRTLFENTRMRDGLHYALLRQDKEKRRNSVMKISEPKKTATKMSLTRRWL